MYPRYYTFLFMEDKLKKWRLILGKQSDPENQMSLEGEAKGMDKVLEALYDTDRKGGLGKSSPNVNRWLGDIRKYFPTPVVQLMQKDALERLGLDQMLLEPELLEAVEPDVHLVSTILALNKVLPQQSRETARMVVEKVVRQLEKRLRSPLQKAISGSINRTQKNFRPKYNEIDWPKTIYANLKHYQADYKTVIPEKLIGYGKKGRQLKHIILLMDQSGSMATSVVYAGVCSCILASLRSVKTTLIAFDTNVVNLSEHLNDPVDLLFATQLGGGTDISKALSYTQSQIVTPSETILVLLSDLFEGVQEDAMLKKAATLKASGVNFITLLALNDQGAPSYDKEIAAKLASLNIPSFACTPDQFPELMATAIEGKDIQNWMTINQIEPKG